MRQKRSHRSRAQSIIETVVGIIFLIPIVLLLFDVGVLVLANTANDNLAKQAARAAAGAQGAANAAPGDASFHNNAKIAADAVLNRYVANATNNGYFAGVKRVYFAYADSGGGSPYSDGTAPGPANPGPGNVEISTSYRVRCPVAFPGFDGDKTFVARAVEPIVSQPP